MRQAYFDMKVVSPYARSYLSMTHKQLYENAEHSKNREYKQRINEVEHADFTPLIFTTAGGMGPKTRVFLKRVTERLSETKDVHPSVMAGWVRCRFSFALLRTTLICLRGSRKKRKYVSVDVNDVERAVHESQIEH